MLEQFLSLDTVNKNTDSQAAMAEPAEHATAPQKVPVSSLGNSLKSLLKI